MNTAETGGGDPDRVILRTPRLELREMTRSDLPTLRAILQDPVTMAVYEGAFDDAMVEEWLERMLTRYRTDGFGLWAVTLREESGAETVGVSIPEGGAQGMIGQCGLSVQHILGEDVIDVGYLFNRGLWHRGLATEAAAACRDLAFTTLGVDRVHAQVRDTNIASMNVAIRLGMTVRGRFLKHYRGVEMPHLDFAVDRPEG